MNDAMLGTIIPFAGAFVPRGWAPCDGQLLQIRENSGLYSVLGNLFGGDGRSTFALPDLRGRVPLHPTESAAEGASDHGLSKSVFAQTGGAEQVTLGVEHIGEHRHAVHCDDQAGTRWHPEGMFPAFTEVNNDGRTKVKSYRGTQVDTVPMHPSVITKTGGGKPHENRQSYVVLNFIIAIQGSYPSRW